jgi:hypothetical protein
LIAERLGPKCQLILTAPADKFTIEYAEHWLNDRVALKALWPPYQLPGSPTWDEDPFHNRSWRLYYHGLLGVGHLLNAYSMTGDLTYLLKAKVLVISWLDTKGDPWLPRSEYIWNEHSVANRVLTFVQLLSLMRSTPLYHEEFERQITGEIEFHAQRLAEDKRYQTNNHGIIQDRALLEVAVLFPELPESSEWFAKATTRLVERLRTDVSPSGVSLEHSPQYQIHFIKLFYTIRDFMEAHEIYGGQFDDVLSAMERYLVYILRADGSLPLIGDTRHSDVRNLFKRRKISEELRYAVSNGRQGRRPQEVDAVFADAGVAVLRDSWESDRPISLVFVAAFHSKMHKHADDLSFVLRVGETDFLIDSGSFNYDGMNPFTAYQRSTLAHNTISVDGTSYPIERELAGRSGIDEYDLGADEARVWGSHRLFAGVTVTRKLTYRKPDEVLIHDVATSNGEREYAQVFNIGKQTEMTRTDSGLVLCDAVGTEVELTQIGPVDGVRQFRGQADPKMGWATNRFGVAFPIDVVHFVKRGRTVEFTTRLVIRR